MVSRVSKRPRLQTALRLTLAAYRKHNASRFGAALAFYIVFSIAPTLLIAIAIAGMVFGRHAAEREIIARIGGSFGAATGAAIGAMIRDAAPRRAGWLATTLAITSLYFGVGGVYRQIRDALRTIWPEKPRQDDAGIIRRIERSIGSTLLVLTVGAILLLSVAADAAIAFTGRYASERLAGGELLWHVAQLVVSTFVLTGIFAAVFRYLPQARVTWRDVRVGAAVTAVLFVAGKLGLGIYLGKAAVGSAFGAAGSIVVVLLWSYWSAQIFFFGLEFTHVYAQEREPADAAPFAWHGRRRVETV
jgi:membrane protein